MCADDPQCAAAFRWSDQDGDFAILCADPFPERFLVLVVINHLITMNRHVFPRITSADFRRASAPPCRLGADLFALSLKTIISTSRFAPLDWQIRRDFCRFGNLQKRFVIY